MSTLVMADGIAAERIVAPDGGMKNKVLFDHISLKNGDVERKGESKWVRVTGVSIANFNHVYLPNSKIKGIR